MTAKCPECGTDLTQYLCKPDCSQPIVYLRPKDTKQMDCPFPPEEGYDAEE